MSSSACSVVIPSGILSTNRRPARQIGLCAAKHAGAEGSSGREKSMTGPWVSHPSERHLKALKTP